MNFLYFQCGDLNFRYDLSMISKSIFQIPYKYNAFCISNQNVDIRFRFYFIDRENLQNWIPDFPIIYSGKMFSVHYEFRKCKKGILYILWNKKKEIVFSALIWHNWKAIIVLNDYTKTHGIFTFEMLGRLLPFCLLQKEALVIHGALMEYDNKGIILSAPSGTGKSTHAHFWRDNYRGLIINGDRSLCRKKNGIWTGYGMPWCGSSGEYINRDVPIRAIVVLQQAEENEVRLLTPLEGFQRMYENLVLPQWDKDKVNQGLDLFDDMLANIPVYLLKCRPEAEAAAVLKREIDKL